MTTTAQGRTAMLAAFAALGVAGAASARVDLEWRPRLSVLGGYDDNVQLNGSGADEFGRFQPGLRLDVFGEHALHLGLDCQASFAHLAHPERFNQGSSSFAAGSECGIGFRDRLSPQSNLHVQGVASYSQDPFAISGLGLLLRPGQTSVTHVRLTTDYDYDVSQRGQLQLGLRTELLDFGANDPGNGTILAPFARYAYRTTPYGTWDIGLREQLFTAFGSSPNALAPKGSPGGLLSESHAALLGYTRRLAARTSVVVRGGPMLLTGQTAAGSVLPVARVELEMLGEFSGAHLAASHDLLIGASRAGPTVADLLEGSLFGELGHPGELAHFTGHTRAGIYRNGDVRTPYAGGSLGYDLEADVAWNFTREWSFGLAALRDAALGNQGNVQIDRDVVQLRLTWELPR